MNQRFLDVVVAKQYETRTNGQADIKTAWNRIGRAWLSHSGTALNFELFLIPNQRYVINFGSLKDEASPQNPKIETRP